MRIVFFGSSDFSVPTLRALAGCERHELVGAAAQPDRPKGRNRKVHPGVVHLAADELGIPIILPASIGSDDALDVLAGWSPELIVVASYGQFIPAKVRKLPSRGIINVHPSLLPKYRGASPLQRSIAEGETVSGVTVFHVVKEMDAGDIVLQEEHPVLPDETAVELSERFAEVGAAMAVQAADLFERDEAPSIPQDDAAATYAPKIEKEEAVMDWSRPAAELHNRVRGFQPWPGNMFVTGGHTVKVWRTRVEGAPRAGRPGEVLEIGKGGPLIMTGDGALRLLEMQPEGKKSMSGDAFLCGHRWVAGMMIDENR